jgi:TonB family protein
LVYREPLKYPEWAQKRAIEGNIRIKFWVEPNGRVAETELLISSGYPELDVFVEEVFRKWLFEPAEENKKVWGEIVFRLRLR